MSPITAAPDGLMRWSARPARNYILEAETEELGRLAFSAKSGSLAKGLTAHGEWTFKREGFLYPRITVRRNEVDGNCGSLTLSANGNGKLSVTGGEEFNFVTDGWLGSWSFNRARVELVRFTRDGSSADVEVINPTVSEETLSLLVLLGWYAPLLAADEVAVMAGAPSIVAAT